MLANDTQAAFVPH